MDLRASIEVWKQVLTNPGEEVFAEELKKPYANLATAVIWLFAAGLIATLVWMLIFLLLDPFSQSLQFAEQFWTQLGMSEVEVAEMVRQMEQTTDLSMMLMLCGFLFGIPLMTIFWSGALWVIAKMFGGNGSFEKQTFLISAVVTPLVIVGMLLYIVPLIGFLIIIGFNIYILYLTYYVMKVVHGLTNGKAVTSVITPVVAMFVFACCFSTLWLMLLSAAAGSLS